MRRIISKLKLDFLRAGPTTSIAMPESHTDRDTDISLPRVEAIGRLRVCCGRNAVYLRDPELSQISASFYYGPGEIFPDLRSAVKAAREVALSVEAPTGPAPYDEEADMNGRIYDLFFNAPGRNGHSELFRCLAKRGGCYRAFPLEAFDEQRSRLPIRLVSTPSEPVMEAIAWGLDGNEYRILIYPGTDTRDRHSPRNENKIKIRML